jgi:Gluconate 2-dehydrogenase subunit 3
MKKNQGLTVPGKNPNREIGINRREIVRRLMLAGGSGFALPGMADGRPLTKHLMSKRKTARADAGVVRAEWSSRFLDQHQVETLTMLGERIIPGSSKAEVSQFIDLLLSVDAQDAQKKFQASLSTFEAESLGRFSHPYRDIAEIQHNDILASTSAEKHGEAKEGRPPQATMHDHFENIKSWVADVYYSSEFGMKGLGLTGQVFFTSFPGCQESGNNYS